MDAARGVFSSRIGDYRIADEVWSCQSLGEGLRCVTRRAVYSSGEDVLLSMIFNEGESSTMVVGAATQFSLASGVRIPRHNGILPAAQSFQETIIIGDHVTSYLRSIHCQKYFFSDWERALYVVHPCSPKATLGGLIRSTEPLFASVPGDVKGDAYVASLSQVVAKVVLLPSSVCRVVSQIGSVLRHIHGAKVAHRSISFDNIVAVMSDSIVEKQAEPTTHPEVDTTSNASSSWDTLDEGGEASGGDRNILAIQESVTVHRIPRVRHVSLTQFGGAIDFNEAHKVGSTTQGWEVRYDSTKMFIGERGYMPPEVLRVQPGRGAKLDYTGADAFSVGVILHNLLRFWIHSLTPATAALPRTLEYPFEGGSEYATEFSYIELSKRLFETIGEKAAEGQVSVVFIRDGVQTAVDVLEYSVFESLAVIARRLCSPHNTTRLSPQDASEALSLIVGLSGEECLARSGDCRGLAVGAAELRSLAEERLAEVKVLTAEKRELVSQVAELQWGASGAEAAEASAAGLRQEVTSLQGQLESQKNGRAIETEQLDMERDKRRTLQSDLRSAEKEIASLKSRLYRDTSSSLETVDSLKGLIEQQKDDFERQLNTLTEQNKSLTELLMQGKHVKVGAGSAAVEPIEATPPPAENTEELPEEPQEEKEAEEEEEEEVPAAPVNTAKDRDSDSESETESALPAATPIPTPTPTPAVSAPETKPRVYESDSSTEDIPVRPRADTRKTLASTDEESTQETPKIAPKAGPKKSAPKKAAPKKSFADSDSDSSSTDFVVPAPRSRAVSKMSSVGDLAASKKTTNAFESSSDADSESSDAPPAPRPRGVSRVSSVGDPLVASKTNAFESSDSDSSSSSAGPPKAVKKAAKKVTAKRARNTSMMSSSSSSSSSVFAVKKAAVKKAPTKTVSKPTFSDSSDSEPEVVVVVEKAAPPAGRRAAAEVQDSSSSDAESGSEEEEEEDAGGLTLTLKRATPQDKIGLSISNMLVTQVAPGSAAWTSGFQKAKGMLLTHVDQVPVMNSSDVKEVSDGKCEAVFTFRVCSFASAVSLNVPVFFT